MNRKTTVSNTATFIDSRDIIRRLEDLSYDKESLEETVKEAQEAFNAAHLSHEGASEETNDNYGELLEAVGSAQESLESAQADLDDWGDADELAALESLNSEGESNAEDWQGGATLILEDHFTEYCQEFLQDVGDLPRNLPPYLVIDWEATADNLRADYSEVDFDGVTYLVK